MRGDEGFFAAAFFGEAALVGLPLVLRAERPVEASLSREEVLSEFLEGCFFTDLVALGSATSTKPSSSSCPKAATAAAATAAPLFDAAAFVVEVFLITLPELTVSAAAASCALAERTTRLGEDLLVNGSGLADFDFALPDFVGEVLRLDARAGVPSARALAIVAESSLVWQITEKVWF